jgi:hypothetical protein
MALSKLEGRITVPSGGRAMTVQEFTPNAGPVAVTVLGSGNYYLSSATSYLTTISAALTANGTLAGTYSLVVDSTTGKTTLSATGVTTFSVTWTDTTLRDSLGFTGNLSGAASYESTKSSTLIWIPNVPRGPARAPDGSNGVASRDMTVTVSPDGSSKALFNSTRYSDLLAWNRISGVKSWIVNESVGNESFESFWLNVIGAGQPFRYHPDRTVQGTYVDYRAVGDGAGTLPLQAAVEGWTTGTLAPHNFAIEVIGYR